MHTKLQALIHDVTQQKPSKTWIRRFLRNNANLITAKRTRRLDLKHTQAFNKTAVVGHFKFLKPLIIDQGIPLENIYNEDEKGIQLGGGRKNLPLHTRKYEKLTGHLNPVKILNLQKHLQSTNILYN